MAAWGTCTFAGTVLFAYLMTRRPRNAWTLAFAETPALTVAPAPVASGKSISALVQPGIDEEAHIPRWRRPSVQSARFSKAVRPEQSPPMRFSAAAPLGIERRIVGFRFVLVADGPDDMTSQEVGRLDRGDEVELLERSLAFARVRAPNGLQGWVLGTTLVEHSETSANQGDDQPT